MTPMKDRKPLKLIRMMFAVLSSLTMMLALSSVGLAVGRAEPAASDSELEADKSEPASSPSASASESPGSSPLPNASGSAPAAAMQSPSPSSAPAPGASLPAVLAEIEQEYASTRTMSARFKQTERIEALDQTKNSEGVILIKRPDKIRWETQKPDPSLLVGNGRKFWFYTPPFEEGERGQVIEQDARRIRSRLAHALLSGSFSAARDMKIVQLSSEHFKLIPRKGSSGTVREAELRVSPEKKRIERVILLHEGGNRSDISLSEIKLGTELPDSLFRFVPPPNTDRMQSD